MTEDYAVKLRERMRECRAATGHALKCVSDCTTCRYLASAFAMNHRNPYTGEYVGARGVRWSEADLASPWAQIFR